MCPRSGQDPVLNTPVGAEWKMFQLHVKEMAVESFDFVYCPISIHPHSPPPFPPPPHYIVSAQKYLTEYLRATSSGKCELKLNKKQDHCFSEKQIHVKPCIFQNLISANCSHSTSQKQTALVYRALKTSCWLLRIIEMYIFKKFVYKTFISYFLRKLVNVKIILW